MASTAPSRLSLPAVQQAVSKTNTVLGTVVGLFGHFAALLATILIGPFVSVFIGIPLALFSIITVGLAAGVFLIKGAALLPRLAWSLLSFIRARNDAESRRPTDDVATKYVVDERGAGVVGDRVRVQHYPYQEVNGNYVGLSAAANDTPEGTLQVTSPLYQQSTQTGPSPIESPILRSRRRHHRRHTSGSLSRSGASSPELVRAPLNLSTISYLSFDDLLNNRKDDR